MNPLVIVGPTASGKSALAVALARRVEGTEIVSADAMAVYRGMDVGTAKPSAAERTEIPHHLVDIADPSEDYSVSRFATEAAVALADIEARGAIPVLVGGTGLYVRAIVDDLEIPGQYPSVRADLDADPDTAALHRRLAVVDPASATRMEPTNRRRIVRALEVSIGSGRPFSSFGPGLTTYEPSRFLQAGLEIDREVMDARIDQRFDEQVERGFVDEVRSLAARGALGRTAAQALGYRELLDHIENDTELDTALDEAKRRTRRFARRQQRWFRRDPRIRWFDSQAADLVSQVEMWWGESSR